MLYKEVRNNTRLGMYITTYALATFLFLVSMILVRIDLTEDY